MLVFPIQMARTIEADMRDLKVSTWRDVVAAVLDKLGGKASLSELYEAIDGHKKTKNNPHWKAKIRQTLQMGDCFTSSERGVWSVAAA